MGAFSQGLNAGSNVVRIRNQSQQFKQTRQDQAKAAGLKTAKDAFTTLEKDFQTNLQALIKGRAASAEEPQFPKEFTDGLLAPSAARLDDMAKKFGFASPSYTAQYKAAMSAPLGSQLAEQKGKLSTIEGQAAVAAGGGFSQQELPNGQIQQTDNVTGKVNLLGSETNRRLITIAGKTQFRSDEEILAAQEQGLSIGDPEKDPSTKAAWNTATGQFVYATDSQIASDSNIVPPSAGHLASRLEVAAAALGIDPSIIRSGNLGSLDPAKAQQILDHLQKTDPMTAMITQMLQGGQGSASAAPSPFPGVNPGEQEVGLDSSGRLSRIKQLRAKKAAAAGG